MGTWIPAGADPDKFAELANKDGLLIKNLPAKTVLQLEAMDGAILRLTILEPQKNRVRLTIRKSKAVDGEYEGILQGSTFGGALIKIGWIGVGMQLEFIVPRDDKPLIIWSWIKSIGLDVSNPPEVRIKNI